MSTVLSLAGLAVAFLAVLAAAVFAARMIRRDRENARRELERVKARVAADEHWASVRDTVCTDEAERAGQIEQLSREIREYGKSSTEGEADER